MVEHLYHHPQINSSNPVTGNGSGKNCEKNYNDQWGQHCGRTVVEQWQSSGRTVLEQWQSSGRTVVEHMSQNPKINSSNPAISNDSGKMAKSKS